MKTDNRQKCLDLWDDRFVGWPRLENNPIHKDDITRFTSERKVLDYRLEPLSVREFGGMLLSHSIAQPFTVETEQARMTHMLLA